MKKNNALFNKTEFKKMPEEFRIGAIISDGVWYSFTKWKKWAAIKNDEVIIEWINRHLEDGTLIKSETGAKSYRFPLKSVQKWYSQNNLSLDDQLLEFVFPPRIWDGKTETEGFIDAPRREVGVVSFRCSTEVSKDVQRNLLGIAKVKELEPNYYKAFGLDSTMIKKIVEDVYKKYPKNELGKIHARANSKRREMVDFSKDFSSNLVSFYRDYGKSMLRSAKDTLKIFIPDPEDQETQISLWVIDAIEKFDESTSVPFSGYFSKVITKWPYDLPNLHLGKDLSIFQRERSKAIKSLSAKTGRNSFTSAEIAAEAGYSITDFTTLEERHRFWQSSQSSTTLNWDMNGDEKDVGFVIGGHNNSTATDIVLANSISLALIRTALATENFYDAFNLIEQIDAGELKIEKIDEVSEDFIQSLGIELEI